MDLQPRNHGALTAKPCGRPAQVGEITAEVDASDAVSLAQCDYTQRLRRGDRVIYSVPFCGDLERAMMEIGDAAKGQAALDTKTDELLEGIEG